MIAYPHFDPVIFHLGPFQPRWYGMMYVFGILTGWLLGRSRAKREGSPMSLEAFDSLITYCVLGVVLGGRTGYVLFYNLSYFLAYPLKVFAVWEGGMSFHGGLLGVIFALWAFARRHGLGLRQVTDFVAPLVPPGLFFGRLGNFINGELWGRTTDVPWAMVFPGGGAVPRHPSQLYEAALEGVVMFAALWTYSAKPRGTGRVSGLFLLLYALFRFSLEFVRQPDVQLGFVAFGWMSMGQVLCLPMAAVGVWLFVLKQKKGPARR